MMIELTDMFGVPLKVGTRVLYTKTETNFAAALYTGVIVDSSMYHDRPSIIIKVDGCDCTIQRFCTDVVSTEPIRQMHPEIFI